MFPQAATVIQNLARRSNCSGFADYLDDLGNIPGFEDLLNHRIGTIDIEGRVDEPNPRHWQKLGLAASFPT